LKVFENKLSDLIESNKKLIETYQKKMDESIETLKTYD